jgi:hypothetical protein
MATLPKIVDKDGATVVSGWGTLLTFLGCGTVLSI